MARVLLVVEDFSQLTALETILKKVGFDVETTSNELSISESILSFAPQLLIVGGRGKRVNPFKVAKKMKTSADGPKVLLLISQRPNPRDMSGAKIDSLVQIPTIANDFLNSVAKCLGLESEPLIKKYEQLNFGESEGAGLFQAPPAPSSETVSGSVSDAERVEKYASFLEDLPEPEQDGFSATDARNLWRDVQEDWDFEEIDEIDQQKRTFALGLLKLGRK